MKRISLEKLSWWMLALTALSMMLFEAVGFFRLFEGNMEVTKWAFIISGIGAWVFLIMRGIIWLRRRNGFYA